MCPLSVLTSFQDVKLYDPFGMKYLLVESGTVVSEGSSDHLTTFTVEKYLNKTSNDYYYKLKVQNSSEYVYFTDSMELKVGVSPDLYILPGFCNTG